MANKEKETKVVVEEQAGPSFVTQETTLAQPMVVPIAAQGPVNIRLAAPGIVHTHDEAFWGMIRDSTAAISFNQLARFMDRAMCEPDSADFKEVRREARGHGLPFPQVDAYNLLKVATEVFLMRNCGVMSSPMRHALKDGEAVDNAALAGKKVRRGEVKAAFEELRDAESFERRMTRRSAPERHRQSGGGHRRSSRGHARRREPSARREPARGD